MRNKTFITIIFVQFLLILSSAACTERKAMNAALKEKTYEASPADKDIAEAKKQVKEHPEFVKNHNHLAFAYLKKVRETGNYDINREAEKSIQKALEIERDNYEAQMLQTQIYLSEHKFQEALDLSKKLTEQRPAETTAYVAMTDALTELGSYEEAVKTAQKLVDMRPNATSYTRVAHLRSLYGDTDGAIEARKLALKISDPDDKEGLAWHHSELGKEFFNAGKFTEAEKAFDAALQIFPDYHWALAGKGKARAAQGDLEYALQIYQKLYARNQQATDRAIFLGDLYKKLGRTEEAQTIYDETIKRNRENPEGDLHRLAQFWADQNTNLDEALNIAEQDRKANSDLLASDTLAWCLFKKGKFQEARNYIQEAMRLNTKNAQFYFHAGMIENALGNKDEAAKYLQKAIETNPSFDILQVDIAKQTLSALK